MAISDSESSSSNRDSDHRSRSRSRSRSRGRSRSRSYSPVRRVSVSTMTKPYKVRKRSPKRTKLRLERHLMENHDKLVDKIPEDATVMWIEYEKKAENSRNFPRSFCTGIRQVCRKRDPVTKRYVAIPPDGSEDDIYNMAIKFWNKKNKGKKKKRSSKKRVSAKKKK